MKGEQTKNDQEANKEKNNCKRWGKFTFNRKDGVEKNIYCLLDSYGHVLHFTSSPYIKIVN